VDSGAGKQCLESIADNQVALLPVARALLEEAEAAGLLSDNGTATTPSLLFGSPFGEARVWLVSFFTTPCCTV